MILGELIKVLKDLDGSSKYASDISKKLVYDKELAAKSQLTLTMVLHAVYEKGVADKALVAQLQAIIKSL